MKKHFLKNILISAFFIAFTGVLLCYFAALKITSRRNSAVASHSFSHGETELAVRAEDGLTLYASYLKGDSSKAVILLAGIGANRSSLIERGLFYREKGFHVIMPDLRATGKSQGDIISFGWFETKDLQTWIKYLNSKGINNVGVHGVSLGAATIVYSLKDNPVYSFMVLESCYNNIDQTFQNRIDKYHLSADLFFLVRFFVEKRIGVKTEDLYPENYIHMAKCPILFLAGDSEQQVRVEETQKLFANSRSPYKKLHFFKGGKHIDFMKRYGAEYVNELNSFLRK